MSNYYIKVLFFANLKENVSQSSIEIETPVLFTVKALKIYLANRFPGLKETISSVIVSVNGGFAFDEDEIPEAAEVALFPPVSGGGSGATLVEITSNPLDIQVFLNQVIQDSDGAACIFTGFVRGINQGSEPQETLWLEYEAYVPMAESKLTQIAQEIRQRWLAVEGIVLAQRTGKLEPGTLTVVVICAASHRDTGIFEAARYGIDRIKEIVPVWKKEISPAGEAWVEGHYYPRRGD